MLVTIMNMQSKVLHDYYYYLNRWNGNKKEPYTVEQHGNAKASHSVAYYKKDLQLFKKFDMKISSGKSVDQIYVEESKSPCKSVSMTLHDQKLKVSAATSSGKRCTS